MLRIPDKIHEELTNWARWANLGAWPHPLPRTQCGSLEGDYRPPVWEAIDMEEAPPPPRIRPNERNAKKVQAAWESLEGFPRLTLKAEYPSRVPEQSRQDRADALRLTVQQYENNLQIAVNRVEAAFAVCN
jgi:hypothetical protein